MVVTHNFRIIIMELVCLACLFYKRRAHCINILKEVLRVRLVSHNIDYNGY